MTGSDPLPPALRAGEVAVDDHATTVRQRFDWLQAVVRARTTATALRVAVCIAAHLNAARSEAWPSLESVASWCGIDKRNASRATRELELAGLLIVAERGGPRRSRRYRLPTVSPEPPLRCAQERRCGVRGNAAAVFVETPEHGVNTERKRSEHGKRAGSRARSASAARAAHRAQGWRASKAKPF